MGPTFLESIFSTGSTGLGPVSCATSCSSSARSSAPQQKQLSMLPWTGQRGRTLCKYMQDQVALWQNILQNGKAADALSLSQPSRCHKEFQEST